MTDNGRHFLKYTSFISAVSQCSRIIVHTFFAKQTGQKVQTCSGMSFQLYVLKPIFKVQSDGST